MVGPPSTFITIPFHLSDQSPNAVDVVRVSDTVQRLVVVTRVRSITFQLHDICYNKSGKYGSNGSSPLYVELLRNDVAVLTG
jgi:hypothetical protein